MQGLKLSSIRHFDGTRDAPVPTDRLRAVRRAAEAFREEWLDQLPGQVYRTPQGIRVSSENGVSTDSWSPEHSTTDAIRRLPYRPAPTSF